MAKTKGPTTETKRREHPPIEQNGDVVVQLATRIPKTLAHALKLYSVTVGISISDLVSRFIKDGMLRESALAKQKKAS
jgi:hypothetical protein